MIIAENDVGWVAFESNELTVGSKVDDPPKVRLTSPITEHGGGGGVVSFNLHHAAGQVVDGHSQIEMGMVRVEQAEDARGTSSPKGELNFLLNYGGEDDAAMQKPLAFIWNRITRTLLDLMGGGRPDTMWAPDGLSFTQQQSDQNFVTYTVSRPYDKSASPRAVWSAWTGKL